MHPIACIDRILKISRRIKTILLYLADSHADNPLLLTQRELQVSRVLEGREGTKARNLTREQTVHHEYTTKVHLIIINSPGIPFHIYFLDTRTKHFSY